MHQTSTPAHLLFHPCSYRTHGPSRPLRVASYGLSPPTRFSAVSQLLRRVPTIVHTQKKWTTVYLIHPASQRPPPPASQCCIPATIAYTSPLTSQRLLAPKEWPKGRLVHPTSSPSTRRSQQRPMPTHRPATFHHPTSGQWTVSHIRHRFRAIVGICISTSRPGNYHIYVSVSLPSLR